MRSVLLIITLLMGLSGYAQEATVRGRVVDRTTGEALPGVNVVFAPGQGTVTDGDGRYTLSLPAGAHTLTFSFVGYSTERKEQELAAGATVVLDVALALASAQLDMVVVSAGKFEQRVGEVTQSLSVLPPRIVRDKNITSLDQVIDQVPGVVVVDNDPQIRAGSGFSFGAGSRVMMLVDDLPILSGDIGRPSWTFLPIENLEQVEVIKGASSVLYGSAALSGVINVRTAYPRSTPTSRATVFAGIHDGPRNKRAQWWDQNNPVMGGASFFHAEQFGNFDLVLGGNAFADNGFVGPEPVPADSVAVDPLVIGPSGYDNRIRFNFATRWRNAKVKGLNYGLNGNVMKSRSSSVLLWQDIDSGLYRPQYGTVTRTLGTQYYLDPFINYLGPAGIRHGFKGRWYYQDFQNDNSQSNASHLFFGQYQAQRQFDLWGTTTITAGLSGQRTQSTAELYSGNPDGSKRNEATNTAAFLQLDKKMVHDRMALSLGVRYENFTVNNDAQATPVFRAGATYQVLEATYLRASYGQGFRFPTIGERFITTSVGQLRIYPNPGLVAEQSWNTEFGIKQGFRIGGWQGYLDLVAFQQDFQDFIEFTFGQWVAPTVENFGGLGFRSVNTGGAQVRGLEAELVGKGTTGKVEWTYLMGYTYTRPRSTTPDLAYARPAESGPASTYTNTSYDTTDQVLKYRVERLFRADMQGEVGRISAGVSLRYNSHVRNIDKIFVSLDESGTLPTQVGEWMRTHTTGDWLLDLRAAWKLTPSLRIAFIVNNATNKEYAIRPLAVEAMRSYQVQFTYSR